MAESAHRRYGPHPAKLRKRSEFLRLRGGARWSGKAFVVEGKRRAGASEPGVRFGYTISKKVGLAHERNRIRRRLSHALRLVPVPDALSDWDCVVIARRPALDLPFEQLVRDVTSALARLASPRPPEASAKPRKEQREKGP